MRGGADEEVDLMADLMRSFEAFNIPIDEGAIERFMHIDDKNNEKFSREIVNDANEVLETMRKTLEKADDESDHTIARACTPFPKSTKNKAISLSLRICTKKSLK